MAAIGCALMTIGLGDLAVAAVHFQQPFHSLLDDPELDERESEESEKDEKQDSVQDPKKLAGELPDHSLWRFGEHGRTPKANGIYRLAYSENGKFLATRNRDFEINIYDIEKQKVICEIQLDERVDSIDFSPDSEFFATAGLGPKVKIWNTKTGKLESEIETDGTAAYFNSVGNAINVLGETHVETYSWPGVQMTTQRKWKTRSNETRSAMSQDGRLVVSFCRLKSGIYQTLVIDLEEKVKVQLDGPTQIPRSVVVSPNRFWVAGTYRDENVRLWDLRDSKRRVYTMRKHTEIVQSLAFSGDSRFLVSTSWDQTAVVWDLLVRQSIGKFKGHAAHVTSVAFDSLENRFATGASGVNDCSVIGWDVQEMLIPPEEKALVEKFEAKDFSKIWKRLGASTIRSSLRGTASLVYGDSAIMDELEFRLPDPIDSGASSTLDELITKLNDPEFQVRQNATEQLMLIRTRAEPRLRELLVESQSPELRYRIGIILKKKFKSRIREHVETRRWGRIVFALELRNTPRSIKLLKQIANGHEEVEVAQDATFALKRIKKREERKLVSKSDE